MSRLPTVLLIMIWANTCAGQPDSGDKKFFNRNFQQEHNSDYVWYYGFAHPVKEGIYEVTLYTMSGDKAAFGEYRGKNLRKRNGVFVYYNSEGKIIITATYKNNVGHGIFQRFYNNGVLADSGRLDRGNMTGFWKSWHDNGQLRELRYYAIGRGAFGSQYSHMQNEFKSWFANGKIQDSGFYKDNKREGVWVEWLENGSVRSIGIYKKNWKKGLWRYYNAQGKLLYMRRFSSFSYDREGEYVPVFD